MQRLPRALARACVGLFACAGALAAIPCPAAEAQELASEAAPAQVMQAPLDKSVGLKAVGDIGKVVVSQPDTVQVGSATPDQLYVIGRDVGVTNLLVYDRDGRLTQTIDLHVGYDAQALRELLAEALPDETITVKGLSSTVLLEGEVSSPAVLFIAERLAERVAPGAVISRLHARSSQVRLEVRIVEVSSRGLTEVSSALAVTDGSNLLAVGGGPIGVDPPHSTAQLHATSGRYTLDATLRALESRGELRVVAEPSMVALSGEMAKFRSGGEFPYPVPADDHQIAIQFRPYGAAMTFQPRIQENGLIRVSIDAELSTIDSAIGLRVAGLNVPGLSMRRASTVAELRDGQSFLLAGLFEESSEREARQTPWLAEIPVIGQAVRALRKKESRRELAFIVTARVGEQASSPLAGEVQLATAPGSEPPATVSSRTPKSVSAPRGPPLRAMVAEVRQALRPPVRWIKQAALRFASTFTGRA